jgi:hypothetical protein
MELRLMTGREFSGLNDLQEAVRISAPQPNSWQHALAMAELARWELRHNLPSGDARADEAVRLARACGSAKALTYALTAKVLARSAADDNNGLLEAEEAQEAAGRARDFRAFVQATLWAGNSLDHTTSLEVIERLRRGREEMTAWVRRTRTLRGSPPSKHQSFFSQATGADALNGCESRWDRRRGRWAMGSPGSLRRYCRAGKVGGTRQKPTSLGRKSFSPSNPPSTSCNSTSSERSSRPIDWAS